MDTLEKVFIEILSNFSVEDLKFAIKNDVDLAKLMVERVPTIVKMIRAFAHFYNNQKNEINADNIVLFLSEKKPEFAKTLMTPQGKKWLNKNIINIKRIIF